MRILLLSWNYPPRLGGIENVIGHLSRRLVRWGDQLVVLTSYSQGVKNTPGNNPRILRAPSPGLAPFLLYCLVRGVGILCGLRPDVILCGSLVTLPVGWILARLRHTPLVVIVYGSDVLQGNRALQAVIHWWLHRADRIVAISRATRDLLLKRNVPPERIAVIPPGIDLQEWEEAPSIAARRRWNHAWEGRHVILSVGRLVRRKGFVELVREVMPQVVRRHPEVLLLIVGSDPDSSLIHRERISDEIRAAVKELGLEQHVRLLGRVPDDDLRVLMMRSELFVLPVRSVPGDMEGFGIVFLEAALAGVPSVSTRVGGVPDAVEHGVTGWLVAPQDINGFSEAVCRLLDDDGERKRLGEAARKRVQERFNWDTLARAYHDTLLELTQ